MKKRLITTAIICLGLASISYAGTYADIPHARFIRCYDGDTCTFTIPGWPPVIGHRIGVRFLGLDAPEMRGQCESEQVLARQARDVLQAKLAAAKRIVLKDVARDKYFRLLARVEADGEDVAQLLIAQGLARPYAGGTRQSWCEPKP